MYDMLDKLRHDLGTLYQGTLCRPHDNNGSMGGEGAVAVNDIDALSAQKPV